MLTGFTAAQNSVELDVNKVNMEPTPLQTSEYADIWFEVTNKGNTDANNVELEFLGNYPFSADPDEKTEWSMGTIVPGEEYQVHLQVRVDKNAVQGENMLRFRLGNGDFSATYEIPVEVRTANNILSISNVSFPDTVAPGTGNELGITFENLADAQLKSIETSLDLSKIPLATSGTTTRTVRTLESGAESEISFNLNVDESAENGVYKIPVEMNYENEVGTEFSRETTIGAVVGGEPELETDLNDVEQLSPGSTGTVTLRLINRGRGSADFVKLSVPESEKYDVLSSDSVYIGGMDPDDYQTADFRIHVNQGTENLSLPVNVAYKDGSGETTLNQEVETPIYSQSQLERYGMAGGGSPLPLVIVVLVLVAGVYYWRRKRNRQE